MASLSSFDPLTQPRCECGAFPIAFLAACRGNGFVYLAFALYVVAYGYLPTKNGRGQAERGKSNKPVHKKSI
jgi:hypothetical protein